MISIENKIDCCGCNVCGDVCPTRALSFFEDNEGFLYPQIDSSICIRCNLCSKVCPIIHCDEIRANNENPDCYEAVHKNIDVVFSSTTGGMFTAFAEIMYKENGYVGGAIHNDSFMVSQFVSNNRDDLSKLRRSKDLQSDSRGFYKKIKELLESNKDVLVCGLPCQIAALKKYLGKEYEKLVTVDLVCLGVNSPKVWREYLNYVENQNQSKIVATENKSKEYGWRNLTQKFVFENGKEEFDTVFTSPFTKGFVKTHLFCRPSCYDCKFKGFPRIADISIGDFWGIEQYDKSLDNDLGTSLVLINSTKGENFFEKAKKRINYKKVPLEWCLSNNTALIKSLNRIVDDRDGFFDDLGKIPFDQLVNKYSKNAKLSFKNQIRKKISYCFRKMKFIKKICSVTRLSPVALYQTIKYSGIRNLRNQKGVLFSNRCVVNISKSAKFTIDGLVIFGYKDRFPGSKIETRLLIAKNGTLKILGDTLIGAGADVEIFENAELIIHGKKHGVSDSNVGCTIICGEKIEIMHDVAMGRNVLIRDTNGNHYMNTLGYRTTRPVYIGEKTWLCESCTIMPGVRTGTGAIVGAFAYVTSSVPDHTIVSGNPAAVCNDNVYFKI